MKRLAPLAALLCLASCSSLRWAGTPPPGSPSEDRLHPPPPQAGSETATPSLSPAPAGPRAGAPLPEPSPAKSATALYYSDLGPDELDVSGYPLQQRHNYRIFANACSRCHGLSRTLYAPYVSASWWEFYVLSMRVRGRLAGRPFTAEERRAVLDFLEHDSKVRKIDGAKDFEARAAELRRRFDALVDERMERLQKSAPALRTKTD